MNVKSKVFYLYLVLLATYAGLTLLPAPDKVALHKYHLTVASARGLDITIIILEAVIWFAAFYAYQKLFAYSQLIRKSKEGKYMAHLAVGLLLLALGLVFSAIGTAIITIIAAHVPSFKAASLNIKNYIGVLFPLLAFIWISFAARGLSNLAKTRPRLLALNLVAFTVFVSGIVFCCLIVNDHLDIRQNYHTSPELIMLTVALPYMYTWFLGLFAVAELHAYSEKLAGVLYRPAWNKVAIGLTAVILLSIAIQYLSTASAWLTSLSLGGILLLLYVLLLLLAAAYIVMALGAKKLIRIEEV